MMLFDSLCRLCTGETLEISQEMAMENGDSTIIEHNETATAIMLQHANDEDCELGGKLSKSKIKCEKMKLKKHTEMQANYAR